MYRFLCALSCTLALAGQTPAPKPIPPLLDPAKPGELPRDGKDQKPVLLGRCEPGAILKHRDAFLEGLKKDPLPEALRARWGQIASPVLLVVAFGSWCSDSQAELPDLLGLLEKPNPFITVHFIGVYRDKQADAACWPTGILPQAIEKVPTFWAYSLQPGGAYRLLGSIVEKPPRPEQRMGEAVIELLEKAE